MIKILWDALLSLTIRAIFAAVLFGGVNWLIWTWCDAEAYYGKNENVDSVHLIRLGYALAGVCVLIGGLGTFRRGSVEQNFSMIDLAQMAGAGASMMLVGAAVYRTGKNRPHVRSFRRFPVFESSLLGGIQILLWLIALVFGPLRFDNWVFATGAVLGAIQMAWGWSIGRRSVKKQTMSEVESADSSNRTLKA